MTADVDTDPTSADEPCPHHADQVAWDCVECLQARLKAVEAEPEDAPQ